MLVKFVITECRDKVSASCTKTFKRKVQRGRPAVNCPECKKIKVVAPTVTSAVVATPSTERDCPCGAKFNIKPGRGRKATKCDKCRAEGTVYRVNDDGQLDAIRAETLAEEQREKAEQAGRDRAGNLFEMMKSLQAKDAARLAAHRQKVAV